ncbi:MAG: cytochrome c [Thermodesulfovibrionales bacterium]|nr:cytochrome c [Thermodesulfovibrionales bacterium]
MQKDIKHHNKLFIIMVILIMAVLCFAFIAIAADAKEKKAGSKGSVAEGEKLYKHYCTPCHGEKGDGKGFNADTLDPKPANHTDAVEMSKRTDEKLFDTIYGGGREVAKSTYMPPWGYTFTETQIDSLVLYLRRLCNCKGPK